MRNARVVTITWSSLHNCSFLYFQSVLVEKSDLSKIITVLMNVKLTVEDIDFRLQRLETANFEKRRPQISIQKITNAETMNKFLSSVHGKEEDYVSKTYVRNYTQKNLVYLNTHSSKCPNPRIYFKI